MNTPAAYESFKKSLEMMSGKKFEELQKVPIEEVVKKKHFKVKPIVNILEKK